MRPNGRLLWHIFALCGLWLHACAAWGQGLPEYRLKTAFLYNFALYTEWPPEVGPTLTLCIYGQDLFGAELDALQGKSVGARRIAIQRVGIRDALAGCNIVFVTSSALIALPRVLEAQRVSPLLTVADSPDAARMGVALNIEMVDSRISFVVNLKALGPRLTLSSKLLHLARDIEQ